MGLIWPTRLNSSPDMFTRLGRVAHWVGLIVAVALFAAGMLLSPVTAGDASGLWFFGGLALVLYFAGRGMRYVLGAE